MSNLVKYSAGSLAAAWTAAFAAADLSALAAGYVAVSSTTFDNSSNGDLWMNISVSLTGTTNSSGSPNIGIYVLPLNADGSTYGDGSVSGAVVPMPNYFSGSILLPLNKTSAVMAGMLRGVRLPENGFRLAVVNNTGNALAASGNSISIRSYAETTNG